MSLPSARRPAPEWIMETSSVSAGVIGGRIPGKSRASMDLPAPGGPIMSM